MPNNTSKAADTAAALAIQKRRDRVMRLRVSGLSMRQVAAKVGVSVFTVHADITAALADIPVDSVRELREVRGEQLEAIIRGNIGGARAGNHDNANAATRAIAEYSKLFGLNAETKVDVSGNVSITAGANEELLARIARLAPASEAAGAGGESDARGGDADPLHVAAVGTAEPAST